MGLAVEVVKINKKNLFGVSICLSLTYSTHRISINFEKRGDNFTFHHT